VYHFCVRLCLFCLCCSTSPQLTLCVCVCVYLCASICCSNAPLSPCCLVTPQLCSEAKVHSEWRQAIYSIVAGHASDTKVSCISSGAIAQVAGMRQITPSEQKYFEQFVQATSFAVHEYELASELKALYSLVGFVQQSHCVPKLSDTTADHIQDVLHRIFSYVHPLGSSSSANNITSTGSN
jgi:hypothetical protein